jgi:hypothetical protein
MVVAMATALQESGLRNLANPRIAESLRFPHQGEGTGFDSLGVFQQRSSQGWGTVAQLMDPSYAAMRMLIWSKDLVTIFRPVRTAKRTVSRCCPSTISSWGARSVASIPIYRVPTSAPVSQNIRVPIG